MEDCIFCKIIKKEISTEVEKEDKDFIVIPDIHPVAPIHFLIIPKKHLKDISEADDALWIKVKNMALALAKDKNLDGFRLTANVGKTAAISHMHLHFLGGITKERKI